jgi:hypothetical protein
MHKLILEKLYGYMTTQCLHTVVMLGIADYLVSGERTSDELAILTDCQPDELYRVLRCLASQDIFLEKDDKVFCLNEMSQLLVKNNPAGIAEFINICGTELYKATADLSYTVKYGKPAFDFQYKSNFWNYLADNPCRAELFNTAMVKGFNNSIEGILAAYDFSPYRRFVDIGGGNGQLICSILNKYELAEGIIYDLPYVAVSAKNYISQNNLTHRCDFIGGDFFKMIPGDGEVYLLRVILHDWDDEKVHIILNNCRNTMKKTSKLIIIEKVVMDGEFKPSACLGDINMLVSLTGKERTMQEYKKLLAQSGFRLNAVKPTETAFSILEASPC